MNPFLDRNIAWFKKKRPELETGVLRERLRHMCWPIGDKFRACEVTINSVCNSKCRFCYMDPTRSAGFTAPSFEVVCRALYKGRSEGAWVASVTGGEPTLANNVGRIAAFARKIGYPCIKLCTNGLALSDMDYALRMRDSGFNMINISLHGVRPEIHDRLVGVPGAFKKVMRAMENVRKLGLELGTKQALNRLNYRTFPEFIRFTMVELGINHFNIIYSNYRGMMARNAALLKVRVSRVVPYLEPALREYGRSGLPAMLILTNFQPCLLPGMEHIFADWRHASEKDEERLLLPDGRTIGMQAMKEKQKAKPPQCAACVYNGECRGVDKEYLALFGGSEFKPVKRRPAPRKIGFIL